MSKRRKTKKEIKCCHIHLCDVCFNNLKNIAELKKVLPRIIVSGETDRPYYEILYWNKYAREYCIGYSSFDLEIVQQYMKEYFGGEG